MSAPRLTVPALDVRLGRAAQDVAVYKPTRCASRTSPPTRVFDNPVAFATLRGSIAEPDPATSQDTRRRRPSVSLTHTSEDLPGNGQPYGDAPPTPFPPSLH